MTRGSDSQPPCYWCSCDALCSYWASTATDHSIATDDAALWSFSDLMELMGEINTQSFWSNRQISCTCIRQQLWCLGEQKQYSIGGWSTTIPHAALCKFLWYNRSSSRTESKTAAAVPGCCLSCLAWLLKLPRPTGTEGKELSVLYYVYPHTCLLFEWVPGFILRVAMDVVNLQKYYLN